MHSSSKERQLHWAKRKSLAELFEEEAIEECKRKLKAFF